MNDEIIKDEDYGLIVGCALRYALGRRTYITGIVSEYIERNLDNLDERTIAVMIRDIHEAEHDKMLGDKCDASAWKHLKNVLIAKAQSFD